MSTPSQYLTSRPLPLRNFSSALRTPDPLFGFNPFMAQGQNMYLASDPYPDYSVVMAQRTQQQAALFQQAAQMRLAAQYTGANIADLTPTEWTPDEAVNQTSVALSKIATVNPELAQELAARRAAAPAQDKGFIEDLFGVIGDVGKATMLRFGEALELISGTMYIVPNLVHDAIDGGSFDPVADIFGGWTGARKHNWNSVLQQAGWKGDGFGGALRAVLGTALDVGTDPLTYLLMGAHLGTAAGSKALGRQAALSSDTLIEAARNVTGKSGDDVLRWMEDVAGRIDGNLMHNTGELAAKYGGADLSERVIAQQMLEFGDAQERVMAMMWETYDQVFNASRRGGIGKLMKKGELTLSNGQVVKVERDIFEQVVRAGNLASASSAQAAQARLMATALPGLRVRAAVPLTNFRYISPVLPGMGWVGNTFNGLRKMLAGQAGMQRLVTLIEHNVDGATWEAMDHWMTNGWESFALKYDKLAARLKGWNNLGGGTYRLSEQLGKATAAMSDANKASRQGLLGYLTYEEKRKIAEKHRQFISKVAYEGKTPDGRVITRRDFVDAGIAIGLHPKPSKVTMTQAEQERLVEYLDILPDDLTKTPLDQLEAELRVRWVEPYERQLTDLNNSSALGDAVEGAINPKQVAETEALISKMEERVVYAMDLIGQMPNSHRDYVDTFIRPVQTYMHNELGKMGYGLGNVKANFETVLAIVPEDVKHYQFGGERQWIPNPEGVGYAYSASTGANAEGTLLGGAHQFVESTAYGHGVVVHFTPPGGVATGTATTVAPRFHRPLLIDPLGESGESVAVIERIVAAVEETSDAAYEAVTRIKQSKLPPGGLLDEMARDEELAKWVNLGLAKEGYDAVAYTDGSVIERILILDPRNVKVVDAGANAVRMGRGYAPRVTAPEFREWLRGKVNAADRRLIWAAPEVERRIERKTINMTWREAEDYIRSYIKEEFSFLGADKLAVLDTMPILDRNILRAHVEYTKSMGIAMQAGMVDDYMRRLTNLGRIAPALFSNSPRANRYEILVDPRLVDILKTLDTKLTPTVEKLAVRSARFTEAEHNAAIELGERYEDFVTSLVHSLGLGEPVQSRHVIALRRWASLYGDVGQYIGKSQRGLRERMAKLTKEEARWNAAQEAAARLPVEMVDGTQVPGHIARDGADLRITVIDEANQLYQVDGFHAAVPTGELGPPRYDEATGEILRPKMAKPVREQIADAEAVDGNFDMHRGGGLHFGSYSTARDRGIDKLFWARDEELHLEGFSKIGTRATGETDFPIMAVQVEFADGTREVVYVETARNRWIAAEQLDDELPYQQLRRRTDAEVEEAAQDEALDHFGELPTRVVSKSSASEDAVREFFGDGNVYYAEDYIYPVTFKGRLPFDPQAVDRPGLDQLNPVFGRGRSDGENILSAAEVANNEVYRVARKQDEPTTRIKMYDSPEEMRNKGYNAVGYVNEYEGPGTHTSFVVFESDALEQPTIYTEMDQLARDGRLFFDEGTQTFLNKRGSFRKGGAAKPVMHIDHINEERQLLQDQLDFLKQAQDEMRSARGKGAEAMGAILDDNQLLQAAERAGTTLGNVIEKFGTREATLARKLARYQDQMTRAMKELNDIYAETQGAVARMKPAFVKVDATKGDMTGLLPLTVPGMAGWVAPDYIAREMNKLFETQTVEGVRKLWRQFVLGPWKRWATFRWFGFHVRNAMGAWFNNLLGGVQNLDYEFALKLRANSKWFERAVVAEDWERMSLRIMFPERLQGKLTYEDIATVLADDGLLGATTATMHFARNGVDLMAEDMGLPMKAAGVARKTGERYDKLMRGVGDNVEQFFRTAAWARGMAMTGGDRMGARAWVMVRHGDYADLTDFEDKLRDVVPFYKWMRTNIPYQVRSMLEQPGVYSALTDKSERLFAEAQNLNYEETQLQMPQWMKEAYTIPYPESIQKMTDRIPGWNLIFGGGADRNEGMKFLMFDLPYKDLYMGLNDYLSAGLPVVRNILESYGFKQQMFTGRKLEGEFIRAASWAQPLMAGFSGIGKALGFEFARKGADGTWYIQNQFENVMTALPIYSKFRKFVLDSPEEDRYVQRMSLLTSAIVGFSIRPADYTAAELDFYYSQIQPVLDQYRSLGVKFPTAEDFQSPEVGSYFGQYTQSYTPSFSKEGALTGFRQN